MSSVGNAAELAVEVPPAPGHVLVPQKHGGALRQGSPHSKGWPPTPERVRVRLRGGFYKRVKVLESIADSEHEPTQNRIAAIALMGRYGGVEERKIELVSPDVQDRVKRTIEAVMAYPGLDDATRDGLLDAIEAVWA